MAQVRLTDNTGEYEVHLVPGLGNIDFPDLFRRLDRLGYGGPFSLDFGTDADKLRIRDSGWPADRRPLHPAKPAHAGPPCASPARGDRRGP